MDGHLSTLSTITIVNSEGLAAARDAVSHKMGVVNDPLGQTHRPASRNNYFHLNIILFCKILKKWGWARTDVRTCVKM